MTEIEEVGVRKRRSRPETKRLMTEFETSGLRRSEFCHRHNMALGTLQRGLKSAGWKSTDKTKVSDWPDCICLLWELLELSISKTGRFFFRLPELLSRRWHRASADRIWAQGQHPPTSANPRRNGRWGW